MITKGNRRNGYPVVVQNGKADCLDQIPLNEKAFTEDWIQVLIHSTPNILPINEIDPIFSPLIPIGREIQTPVGYIDNLYVSPDGYITLVETKLWRNPQARREVVGQIIDYAKEMKKWSFGDLEKSVVAFNKLCNNNSDGLLATVRKHTELDESEESFFIDNISKNLKNGRFLLLIVGDGIQESVEDMVEYLTQTPQLYFTLALVELKVYNLNKEEQSKIILPQIIMRTKEITRAIVRIEGNYSSDLKINIETDLGTETSKSQSDNSKKFTISEQEYFEQLEKNTSKAIADFASQIIKDSEDLGLYIEWNSGSFGIKLPDPLGSGVKIGIVNIDRVGLFYLGFSKGQFEKLHLPRELSFNFAADTAQILPGLIQNPDLKYTWNKYSTLSDLKPVYDEFKERLKRYIDDIRSESERKQS